MVNKHTDPMHAHILFDRRMVSLLFFDLRGFLFVTWKIEVGMSLEHFGLTSS